jgi:predicted RNase H-like nuclease (RuvC/YqgF family)
MPYEWRTRSGLAKSRALAAIPLPLMLILVVIGVAGWHAMRFESASAETVNQSGAPAAASTTQTPADPETPTPQTEISGLRQQVADLDDQVQHQTLVSMAKSDQVQTLESELMKAQEQLIAAGADRDDAVRQSREMLTRLKAKATELETVCKALDAALGSTPQRRASEAAVLACQKAGSK